MSDTSRWRVVCRECGDVSFDVLEHDWFGDRVAATWYAGYHGGKEHPESDTQFGVPKRIKNYE